MFCMNIIYNAMRPARATEYKPTYCLLGVQLPLQGAS